MRLYLDTADTLDWADLMPTGIFYGITTNPLLTKRLDLNYEEIVWEDMISKAAKKAGLDVEFVFIFRISHDFLSYLLAILL